LDGTPLKDAVAAIDAAARPAPAAYLVNCTHASVFRLALCDPANSSDLVRRRVIGLLANTSALSPEELDNSESLVQEDPQLFGRSLAALGRDLGMKLLGGCCGTDDRHIRCLAQQLSTHP
jgi:homocysteine S-methyltransferase